MFGISMRCSGAMFIRTGRQVELRECAVADLRQADSVDQ
jgi:hypothetical protein